MTDFHKTLDIIPIASLYGNDGNQKRVLYNSAHGDYAYQYQSELEHHGYWVQHLCAISDDTIKDNDFYIHRGNLCRSIHTMMRDGIIISTEKEKHKKEDCKRIIASDTGLNGIGLPNKLVEAFVDSEGKIISIVVPIGKRADGSVVYMETDGDLDYENVIIEGKHTTKKGKPWFLGQEQQTSENDLQEIVICSAVWYKNLEAKRGETVQKQSLPINIDHGLVFTGHRHLQCIRLMASITGIRHPQAGAFKEGFLTNKNRFVDRIEGKQIAMSSGQIKKTNYGKLLYSEDIY